VDCILVQGNIEELMQVNLEGKPAAAVEDCSQKLGTYFDFHQLEKIQARKDNPGWVPKVPISPEACVFNRGVLVIDTKEWIKQQVTESIFWWMDEFRNSSSVLYKYVPIPEDFALQFLSSSTDTQAMHMYVQ
jgi:lipopolysaccharide biosynthesis glycosyltransferase